MKHQRIIPSLMVHQFCLVQSNIHPIERPLAFYGIPSVIFLIIGSIFSYSAIQYYIEIGRLNPNLALIGASAFLIGIVFFITAILLFSLVSVVREGKN